MKHLQEMTAMSASHNKLLIDTKIRNSVGIIAIGEGRRINNVCMFAVLYVFGSEVINNARY